MSDWQKLQAYLSPERKIVLLVHEKPDGDCLGSALGLGLFLRELGYCPEIYLPKPIPQLYSFLPGQELIKFKADGAVPENTTVIAVDCGDEKRWDYDLPGSCPLINIDHHISNTMFGVVNIVDTMAAATGEIIYRLMSEAAWELTPDAATCLYVAISTDTGSFRYSNVTPETFRIAGELVAAGADMELVRYELYEKRPLAEILTMKQALETLYFTAEGKIAVARLSYEALSRENLLDTDTDGLIGMLRATDGVELALLFKELEPGTVKVSIRSKSYVDANKLAQSFQGGGHPRASGCTVKGSLRKVEENILKEARLAVAEGCDHGRRN